MATTKKTSSKKSAPTVPARPEPEAPTHVQPTPKTKLSKDELKQFKAQLLALREQLTRQVGHMEREALTGQDQEVSVDHMADHGSDTFDQDFTLGLIENEEQTIREIDIAIERIAEGTYGVCEPCIEDPKRAKSGPHIPKARLEAIPYTRYCVEHARVAERDREMRMCDPGSL